MNIYDIYQISARHISEDVTEISVGHTDWADLQIEIEAKNILIAPSGAFVISDGGLHPIIDEAGLWVAVPKIINLENEEDRNLYSDLHAAKEVIEYLKNYILEVYPNWGKPKPGRRKSLWR